MWLTLATFVGYAIVYTVLLKPATPQNIVIGGASGAMPPVLGWAAIGNEVAPEALILFLIIFAWTPPHFWALALYRTREYERAGLPMLPVTHGARYTQLMIVLYTAILFAVSLLPYAIRMSGLPYLAAASRARRRVPRARDPAVAQLQRRPGARDVQVLDRLSRGTVHRAAGRSLSALMRRLFAAAIAALALAACAPDGPQVQERRRHRRELRPRFRAHRHPRKAARPRRFPRQGRRRVLRVYAVPGRVPDGDGHPRRGDTQARPRRGARAGRVHHDRPGARYARAAVALRTGLSSGLRRALRRCGSRPSASRRSSRSSIAKSPGSTPETYTMDHSAGMFVFDPQGRLRLYVSHGHGRRRARPRPSRAHSDVGVSEAQARAREAARLLGEAVERSPQDARLRYAHAQALKAIGDLNGAIRTLAAGVAAGADGCRALARARRPADGDRARVAVRASRREVRAAGARDRGDRACADARAGRAGRAGASGDDLSLRLRVGARAVMPGRPYQSRRRPLTALHRLTDDRDGADRRSCAAGARNPRFRRADHAPRCASGTALRARARQCLARRLSVRRLPRARDRASGGGPVRGARPENGDDVRVRTRQRRWQRDAQASGAGVSRIGATCAI